MSDMFDLPQDDSAGKVDLVQQLRQNCEEAVELTEVINGYQDAMAAASARLQLLRTKIIPESMSEAGVGAVFSLDTGHIIKISQFVSGSLPKGDNERKNAFAVLESIGGAALIKTVLTANFGKGEKEQADKAKAMLIEAGYTAEVDESVHASTLQAFAREKLANGDPIDLDALGLMAGSVAKITEPKEPKAKKK